MGHAQRERIFSEKRHREGGWKTRVSETRSPLARAAWNFISFKRQGVERLAARLNNDARVLDIGSGTGAYSMWLCGRRSALIIAVDWSQQALRRLPAPHRGRIVRVCADARALPLRSEAFDGFFSIDTLGHIPHMEHALDEMLRIAKPGAPFFIHSECDDHRRRWPDKQLIRSTGTDRLAELDGHWGLRSSADIYINLVGRFRVENFFSPAGILGWLLGYPEKYRLAFIHASWTLCALLTGGFAVLKRTPVLGLFLRFTNAISNRLELFFGIVGGGSCFAFGYKPAPYESSGTES